MGRIDMIAGRRASQWALLTWCGLLAAAGAMYFSGLGSYPLLDPDEGRYAEIPREMLESGDFVTPRLNYVKYFEKPPLFYWAVAASMAGLGETEMAARLVPAVVGLLTVALVIGLGSAMMGRATGHLAGWVYLTSLLPLVMARFLTIDGLFSLLLAATWAAWWLGYSSAAVRARRRWYTAAWLSLALAILAKGPVALVLTGLLVFSFLALQRDWAALRTMAWWPGVPLFAAVVLPWFVAVSICNPEFLHFFVVVQHWERFLGATQEHLKPLWFFLPLVPLGLGAWGIVSLPGLVAAAREALGGLRSAAGSRRRANDSLEGNAAAGDQSTDRQRGAVLFLLTWVIIVVAFFSISKCKLVPYILPAFPALAILVAWYVQRVRERAVLRWCAAITAVAVLALVLLVPHAARNQDTVPYAELTAVVTSMQVGLIAAAVVLCAAVFRPRLAPVGMGLVVMLVLPGLIAVMPDVAAHRKLGTMLKALPFPLPAEVKLAEWENYDQSFNFYTHKRIILIDKRGELEFGSRLGDAPAFFLSGAQAFRELADQGPLLANIDPERWPEVRTWGTLHPVGANCSNVLVANDSFFRLTGLIPWPDDAISDRSPVFMPRYRQAGMERK